jgi:hypothetical protein
VFGFVLFLSLDFLLYILAGVFLIMLGLGMRKNPYLVYSKTKITLYGFFGNERKSYAFDSSDEIDIKNRRLYLNGKLIKANAWLVVREDWNRLLEFYKPAPDKLLNELKD